jgi:hypothetical protein
VAFIKLDFATLYLPFHDHGISAHLRQASTIFLQYSICGYFSHSDAHLSRITKAVLKDIGI